MGIKIQCGVRGEGQIKWELVYKDQEKQEWTFRALVPGGWLYRHTEVTLVNRKEPMYPSEFQSVEPAAMAVTMCFVPDPQLR